MTDGALRALERRWRATGAVEDEAAWLAARLRAGVLAEARLRAAARLGHRAAQAALGDAADDGSPVGTVLRLHEGREGDLAARALDLAALGVAWADALLPLWDAAREESLPGDLEAARVAVDAARRCMATPDGPAARAALQTLEAVRVPRPGTAQALRTAGHLLHAAVRLAAAAAATKDGFATPGLDPVQLARGLSDDAQRLLGVVRWRALAIGALAPRWLT